VGSEWGGILIESVDLVQLGISEKVAIIVTYLGAFVTGFAIAFAKQWKLALALSSLLPCLVITGAVMTYFLVKWYQ